jgi:alkanesulfonate monooxygenase SsuD/methylene tetrahydromethanopterin reductase-like flavin-dependent oxidoreductase (luciferase family)
MNLYLRYFDQETLVTNVDDAIGFLKSIPEIEMDAELEADVREYAASDLTYPKRYKVRPRIYFIVIKTTAQTMQDFKDKKALRTPTPAERMENPVVAKELGFGGVVICGDLWNRFDIHNERDFKELILHFEKLRKAIS